ncbi:hypothetical protein APA_5077 [Pseudanabaena sp. lw0831]|nr:hypothetical protein APA_5077 [Pseudanabaena sp. lw0831]
MAARSAATYLLGFDLSYLSLALLYMSKYIFKLTLISFLNA